VVLGWSNVFSCYTLQYTPELLSPPSTIVWSAHPGPYVASGGNIYVTNGIGTTNRFFRLAFAAPATFTADFNTGTIPAGTSVISNAVVTATGGVGDTGVLRLTEAVGSQFGTWIINDFSSGVPVNAFTASFKIELGNGSAPPADGFSFNWATNLPAGAFNEEGAGTGLTVVFDTFNNGLSEAPAIDVKWESNVVAHSSVPFDFTAANAAFVTVQVTLNNGLVAVAFNGATVHTNIALPGFASFSGAKFGFSARTGGLYERHYMDDVSIVTTSGP
jgi:hypothetical protein